METLELSIARAGRRAARWLAAGLLCLGSGACASLEPTEDLPGDVDRLAERLVQSARERADLRQLRVWVAEVRETRSETTRASTHEAPNDLIGLRLEHELVIALATRLNVVESELVEPGLAGQPRAALGESAVARGATHVLVGDYVRQRDALQITLRLVDTESRLIVAAARGEVKLAEVGLMGFDRWARNETDRGTLAVPGTVPRTTVNQSSESSVRSETGSEAPATASTAAPASTLRPPSAAAPKPTQATLRPPGTDSPKTTQSTLRPPGTTSPKTTQSTLRPPGTTSPKKTQSTLRPPGTASPTATQDTLGPPGTEPAPPKTTPATSSSSRAWPVEDFETWRQRRLAEEASSASQTVAALDQAARASTEPAVQARRNELADRTDQAAEPFPWRQNPWLARLLGIPQTPPR